MSLAARATLILPGVIELERALDRLQRSQTLLLAAQTHPPDAVLELVLSRGEGRDCTVRAKVVLADNDSAGRPRTLVRLEPAQVARASIFLNSALNESEPTTHSGFHFDAPMALGDESGPALLSAGTLVGGRYRIEAFLAAGGMGEVYRALHVHLKRHVALKLVLRELSADDNVRARFLREAQLLSQLESPHVVRVFDFGQTDEGRLFLAMELVEGRGLDRVLAIEKNLAPERAISILVQVCEGLEEAHGHGIVHRDLKPANIMLGQRRDGSELARILDFGVARPTGKDAVSNLTAAGLIIGTPSYMSPEQARGETLDARADLYALGCVAWRLLCGRPPFVADSMVRVVAMQLTEKTPPPESLNPELGRWPSLCKVLERALQKKPADRFGTAREFADALRAASHAPGAVSAFPDWPMVPGVPTPVEEEPVWPPPEPEAASPAEPGPADDFFGLKVSADLLPPAADDEKD